MQAPIKTDAEFAKLFQRADRMRRPMQYRLMLLLSVKLGMRPKEIALMESSWVIGRELRIPQGSSKGQASRTLPLNDEIQAAIRLHMQGRQGRCFINEKGVPMNAKAVSDAFQRLYLLSDEQGSCYSGRRTLATNLVDRNTPLPVVQRVLGHAHLSTTARYVSVTPRMIEAALFA
ncbi:tyrosine-type recombinase/integrase [Brevundimonas sp.]|uniref:tyrosine-type recombinase/integrase n=1 Tax=Brevundimonas sp. TaxID=1871086 RepID=UPI0028982D88|nr:tyrosine-type recombinase/integrase [Brevundimonas sp.]